MISALYGSQLQQKNSFLLDKIGQQIGNEKFTLRDEPHLIGAMGARYFDNEGVATQPRTIFDKGVLKTYFIDTYIANKMGIEPTIDRSINTHSPAGKQRFARTHCRRQQRNIGYGLQRRKQQ